MSSAVPIPSLTTTQNPVALADSKNTFGDVIFAIAPESLAFLQPTPPRQIVPAAATPVADTLSNVSLPMWALIAAGAFLVFRELR